MSNYPLLPFVNSKSRPLLSFEGTKQQDRIASAIITQEGQRLGPALAKLFIDLGDNSKLNHPFYGKVNHLGVPVVPLESGIFGNLPSDDRPVVALDFVSDAFDGYKVIFDNYMAIDSSVAKFCSARNFNSSVGVVENLSESKMQAKKGWTNPAMLHRRHLDSEIRPALINGYVAPNQQDINSINDFMQQVLTFTKENSRDCLLTFTSFVLSTETPIHSTGLAVSIMQADDNDARARINMISDTGFENLISMYNKTGFRCDSNSPWTMVADLTSRTITKRMQEKGVDTPEQMFREYYIETYILDNTKLTDFIVDCYMEFVDNSKFSKKTTYCADGSVDRVTHIPREDVGKSGSEIKSEMSMSLLLRIYLEARNLELPQPRSEAVILRIHSLAMAKLSSKDINTAFKVANREMTNLDERFLELKLQEPPTYLTPSESSVKVDVENYETSIGSSGPSQGNTQSQTAAGSSGIAGGAPSTPGGGSAGGGGGGY